MTATSYRDAVRMRQKTDEDIMREMDEPFTANFAQYEYHLPNGVIAGVGKSRIPGHASLFQLAIVDHDGKNAFKFPEEYRGEYTSQVRAETALRNYTREAWEAAEAAQTKATRKEAAKDAAASGE